MPTLTDYRKAAGYTSIRTFAEAAQQAGVALRYTFQKHEYERTFTPSIAQQWLQGYYREDLKPDDITKLLTLLNITEEEYHASAEESRAVVEAKWRAKHPVTQEMLDAHEASIKKTADRIYARMTPIEKAQVHQDAIRLGIAKPERRSPLDMLIDQACGRE